MQDEKQFEQLIMQYNQLKNGALDIRRMIENEDYDSAISMVKSREEIFRNCKCMRRYLELTPVQEKELNTILDELRTLESENISMLSKYMMDVQKELKVTQKNEKLQMAYGYDETAKGSIVNVEE